MSIKLIHDLKEANYEMDDSRNISLDLLFGFPTEDNSVYSSTEWLHHLKVYSL